MSKMEAGSALSEDTESNLDRWAESLIERHGQDRLSLIPYDPLNAYHAPDFVKAEPVHYGYEDAVRRGSQAIGAQNFESFLSDIESLPDKTGHPFGTARLIKARLGVKNHNVALVTNHADLMDLPLAQTALFAAMKDDRLPDQSAIIVSRTMTRLAYEGTPVIDMLRRNGAVYFNMPRTSSAEKYGIQEDQSVAFNRRMGRQLAEDLKRLNSQGKSMLLAVSLSGKTAEKNDGHIVMPDYEPTTGKLMLSRFRFVLPLSIYLKSLARGSDWYRLHTPEVLGWEADIARVVQMLALDTVDLSGEKVRHGGRTYLGKLALKD